MNIMIINKFPKKREGNIKKRDRSCEVVTP